MRIQESGNCRRSGVPRSCTFMRVHTTKDKCFKFYGILKREKCTHDI